MCSCLLVHGGKHVCNTAVVMVTLGVEKGISLGLVSELDLEHASKRKR